MKKSKPILISILILVTVSCISNKAEETGDDPLYDF